MMQDEAAGGYDAYSIINSGKDHHGQKFPLTFQSFNDWIAHSYVYQLIPFVKIMGLSVFSIRFSVVFLSVITILIMYLLTFELTHSYLLSFIVYLLFSLSGFAVTISRWSIPPNTVPFYISLSLLIFLLGINHLKRGNLLFIISGFLFGLTIYAYPSVEGMIPVWLISCCYVIVRRSPADRRDPAEAGQSPTKFRKPIILLLMTFFLLTIPIIHEHITKPQTLTNRLSMISVSSLTQTPVVNYIQNYLSYYLPSPLFLPGEVNPTRTVPGFGYENWVLGLFYYYGVVLILFIPKKIKKIYPPFDYLKINVVRLFILLFPVIPGLTLPGGDFQRATHFLPILILITGIGFHVLYLDLKRYLRNNITAFAFIVTAIIGLYFYNSYNFYNNYFGEKYKSITQWYFQNGLDKVIEFTSDNESNYKNIIIDSTINQPYIYVLFYKKFDPKNLNEEDYKNFSEVDPKTNWLSVKKFRNYYFQKINTEDLKSAKLVKTIINSPYSNYGVYEKNNNLIVRFEPLI